MAAALSFERWRSRNFLVLTRIRKLASLCFAFDRSVTVRWVPSEINVSDRPSRIHDPSDNPRQEFDQPVDNGGGDKMMAERRCPGRQPP